MKKFFAILLIIFFVFNTYSVASESSDIIKGKVLSESKKHMDSSEYQILNVELLDKPYNQKIIEVQHLLIGCSSSNQTYNKGDTLLLKVSSANGKLSGTVVDSFRLGSLKTLSIIFIVLLVLFGRFKGIRSLLALVFSGFVIVKGLIPCIMKGYNSTFCAVAFCGIIIVFSFIMISGFTKKTYVSIVGTLCGTLSAGLLSIIFTNISHISGLVNDESVFLATNMGLNIDFKGLFLCAVIIGTIGVVMDVSMSITSVVFEIKKKSPTISFVELLNSGLNVGKDVMSTMINTLVLAYVGSFLPLLLIFVMSKTPLLNALNTEIIASEAIRSLCGSIGLILTIPFTALIASYVAYHTTTRNNYLYSSVHRS